MTPEFSRPFAADRAATSPDQTVEATPPECAALALRLGIPAVRALSCRFRLRPGLLGVVEAEASLVARLVRICVVSLDQFETPVIERFRVRFVPADRMPAGSIPEPGAESDEELDPESDDEIPYDGASIDLGEAAAEQLALTLDPYPRQPGAELPDAPDESAVSPFAALGRLRRPED